ncbi:MAG: NAD(P)-dependent oxidoreductase [Rhodoferax sp.]|nr:NAD(P)-dependent oxidoreductase [Rhodoferax sp.]
MKVAVFGSGGYIGQRLVARLVGEQLQVVRYSSGEGHLFDPASGVMREHVALPTGTNCVVYLSQSPKNRHMPDAAGHLWGVNVVSAIRVAALARQAGVRRFIYASTGNVYQPGFGLLREDSPVRRDDWYALSKVQAEEALALFKNDMSMLSMRIFGVYGPNQTGRLVPNLVQSVRAGLPIRVDPHPTDSSDNGGLRVSLCYIDDAVQILSRLIASQLDGVINIAGPEVRSVSDIARAIGEKLGLSPRLETASSPRAFDLMADITRLVEVCQPKFTSFEDGLRVVLNPNGA